MHSTYRSSVLLIVGCLSCTTPLPALAQQIRGSAVDVKGQRHVSTAGQESPWLADCLSSPQPQYTYEDRAHHYQGSGLFRVIIDAGSGSVSKVMVQRSTGVPALDYRAIGALKKWRWKPGTWKEVDMPITFTMAPRH